MTPTNRELSEATRRRIVEAFWDTALEAGGIGKITVWSLMKQVDMNRSTFYQYFDDIGDLLRQSADDLVAEFRSACGSAAGTADDVSAEIRRFLYPVRARKIVIIMWSGACPDLFDRMCDVGADVLSRMYPGSADGKSMGRISGMLLMMTIGVTASHMNDSEDAVDEMGRYEEMAYEGMRSYLGEWGRAAPAAPGE